MALYKRIPTQIVVSAYTSEDGAETAAKQLIEAVADEKVVVTNIAIAKCDQQGHTRVKELGKPGFVKGLVAGTAVGGAAGAAIGGASLALLGPIGVWSGATAGGLAGGALGSVKGAVLGSVGRMTTEGMSKDKLKSLGSALQPGTSAIVAVFGEVVVKKSAFPEELKEHKEFTDDLATLMSEQISENLKQGKSVAYLMAVTEDGTILTKVTVGADSINFKELVITPDAVAAKQVEVTPEGVAVEEAVVTEEGVAGAAAIMTDEAVVYEAAAETDNEAVYEGGVAVNE